MESPTAAPAAPAALAAPAPRKRPRESLIVAKAARELVKPMAWSADAMPALEAAVHDLVARAAFRARCNGRQTVKEWDL